MTLKSLLQHAERLREQGQWQEAQAVLQVAETTFPQAPEVANEFGNFFQQQRQFAKAVPHYQRALSLRPNMVEAFNNLGSAWKQLSQFEQAEDCFQRAIAQRPELPELHNNLSNVFHSQGRFSEAAACCQKALHLRPNFVGALTNLGNACTGLGRLDEAISIYQQALVVQPEFVEAAFNLANVLRRKGRLSDAVQHYESTLRWQPTHADAWQNLGVTRKLQGQLAPATDCFLKAAELSPHEPQRDANLLFLSQFLPGEFGPLGPSVSELLQQHRQWDQRHAAAFMPGVRTWSNDRNLDRRLRVGMLSADLGHHPVGLFLVRTIEALPVDDFEIACYSDRPSEDEVTQRFRKCSTIWRETYGWPDQKLADQIRDDRVDVLFDLAGHTANNRLLVMARRPAPVQCTYIGYPGTTGLAAIDYLLTDAFHIPQDVGLDDEMASERILRLPGAPFCFEPPQLDVAVGPLPALTSGCVTFGSFNNPAKFNAAVISVWSEILRRVPNSRLVLKYTGLDDIGTQDLFRSAFTHQGIETDRIYLQGHSSFRQMLDEYQEVDIALDPFPFTGGLTTLLALWMGLPVVTCPGESFASRQSMSYLKHMGWTHTLATSLDEYVDIAVLAASDLKRLAMWRQELRTLLLNSPLCDAQRFAAEFAAAIRFMWRDRSHDSSAKQLAFAQDT